MERHRLYRGNSLECKVWHYGDLVIDEEVYYILHGLRWVIEVAADTVGQFTGLFDKNQRKIFEGDIMIDKYGNKGVVEYSAAPFIVDMKAQGQDGILYAWEAILSDNPMWVVGNIHDNPELLKIDER